MKKLGLVLVLLVFATGTGFAQGYSPKATKHRTYQRTVYASSKVEAGLRSYKYGNAYSIRKVSPSPKSRAYRVSYRGAR